VIKELCLRFDPNALTHSAGNRVSTKPNSLLVRKRMEEWFRNIWDKARTAYSKLTFYNQIKVNFAKEPYIQLSNHKKAKCIAWLRSSSHRLNIETGRYGNKIKSLHHRACNFCSTQEKEVLELMAVLPTSELIIENEFHFLRECGKYEALKMEQSPEFNQKLKIDIGALFDQEYLVETSNFSHKLFKMRFELP
jgi:hypothetical protein